MSRTAAALACLALVSAVTPTASAEPEPEQSVVEPGAVPSGPPGILDTPDGWRIEVGARDETQLAVAPLTTALSTREYLVGGTFVGTATGAGSTQLDGGTLVAGYQIGCGILGDEMKVTPGAKLDIGLPIPDIDAEVSLNGSVALLPGQISVVDVADKSFDGSEARVTITGLRVNFDRCVGQSFIRSYATLAIATADTQDVITYLGVTTIV